MQTVITKEFVAVMAAPATVDGTTNRIVQVILLKLMFSTVIAPDVTEILKKGTNNYMLYYSFSVLLFKRYRLQ